MKFSNLIVVVVVFAAGFAAGTFVAVQYPDLLRTTEKGKNLYDMLQQGSVAIGSDVGSLVLPESTAYHKHKDKTGRTLVTAVYQQSGQIMLLRSVDDKISELTLWKKHYRAPDMYLARTE